MSKRFKDLTHFVIFGSIKDEPIYKQKANEEYAVFNIRSRATKKRDTYKFNCLMFSEARLKALKKLRLKDSKVMVHGYIHEFKERVYFICQQIVTVSASEESVIVEDYEPGALLFFDEEADELFGQDNKESDIEDIWSDYTNRKKDK